MYCNSNNTSQLMTKNIQFLNYVRLYLENKYNSVFNFDRSKKRHFVYICITNIIGIWFCISAW